MLRGVIYARYSSEKQSEKSIDGQIRENKVYAERNGIEIVGEYIDRAKSAKTDKRPEFQRMIKDSAKHGFDVVIVWKLDRFARNRFDSAKYKMLLRMNNVKLVSATETISEGPAGILLEALLEASAESYSIELAEKVTRGMTENALICKYNGGNLPIGFAVDAEKNIVLDEIAAPLVLQAFTDYDSGVSMRQIADNLNLAGVRTCKGGKVNNNCVTKMLHNRRYLGEYRFNDVVVPGGVPRIVPDDLFERVQEKNSRTKLYAQNSRRTRNICSRRSSFAESADAIWSERADAEKWARSTAITSAFQ